ncbi:MAG: N-acylneuraminate-9-phosphate synthase [Caulobacteraceae bacterium]|nr:N-acylneuraminate-9-phosphate synthase [Caulobacteraceae bacterium]
MSSPRIEIDGRLIGPEFEPFVICELSGNHNGSLDRALAMIDAAVATGADAIKLQTYTADSITMPVDRPEFRIEGGLWHGRSLHDLYDEAHTPYEWHRALFERARQLGVILFSTPFDQTAIDLLEGLDAPAYKIASFEVVDLPLIRAVASCRKPMIISTGLANEQEIADALETAHAGGASQVALLHCISAYPAPMEEANVRTVPLLAQRFGTVVGLSDHTHGLAASVASIALGGSIVEKHFTLARADGGPDAAFSLEPHEFRDLVSNCKDAWRALGQAGFDLKGSEAGNIVYRRSIYVSRDVAAGEPLSLDNIRTIRPGHGLAPRHLPDLVGRHAKRGLKRGEALTWDMVD